MQFPRNSKSNRTWCAQSQSKVLNWLQQEQHFLVSPRPMTRLYLLILIKQLLCFCCPSLSNKLTESQLNNSSLQHKYPSLVMENTGHVNVFLVLTHLAQFRNRCGIRCVGSRVNPKIWWKGGSPGPQLGTCGLHFTCIAGWESQTECWMFKITLTYRCLENITLCLLGLECW